MQLLRNGITFLAEDGPDSAAAFYRCWFPASCLTNAVVCREMGFSDVLQGIETEEVVYLPTNTVILRMPMGDISAALFTARRNGQRICLDIDDDVWHLPKANPAAKTFTLKNIAMLQRNMNAADCILVPTETLAESVHEVCNTPVEIIPSGIDANDWPKAEIRSGGRLRVGWIGTLPFRGRDLEMVVQPLLKALQQCEAEFWHIGALQSDPAWLGDNCVAVPWKPFRQLGEAVAQLDMAIIPALSNRFNQSRSPTTGMVIAACGVPFWASRTTAYVDLFGDALPESIGQLIHDADYRCSIQAQQFAALTKVDRGATAERYERLFASH